MSLNGRNLTICNCEKCGRVFPNGSNTLVKNTRVCCPDCLKTEEEQFTKLYRLLQRSTSQGGISIDEVSSQLNIPAADIEALYWSGKLGTAGTCLMFHCQDCGLLMRELQRRGRFCINCSEKTAGQAGVEVRSVQNIQAAEEETQRKQRMEGLLKKNQKPPTPERGKGYGFTTR